jgi:hypothetical protein
MLADYSGQLKHGHLIFAKNGAQYGVGVNGALVVRVLQAVRLNVVP